MTAKPDLAELVSAAQVTPRFRKAALQAQKDLPSDLRYELERWQFGYIIGAPIPADKVVATHRAALRRHYAPVLALLSTPHVRLYRGESLDDEIRHRAFLSWTEHRGEAESYAEREGMLRVADVPVSRVLAVLPHGEGLEWLVTPGPIRGEKRVAVTLQASIDISPRAALDSPNWWLPGTAERQRARSAILRVGGTELVWRRRRDNDEDYWSGYDPLPDHGTWYFRATTTGLERLRRAGFEVWG